MAIPSLINFMAKQLIKEECFNVPKDSEDSFLISDTYCTLQKTGIESSCIIEIFDSNSFTEEDVIGKIKSKPEQSADIGLINTENIFRIKVFIINRLSNDFVKWAEEYYNETAAISNDCAVLVMSLESKDIILNRGIVYPYGKICDILKECLKFDSEKLEKEQTDFDQLLKQRFEERVTVREFELLDSPVNTRIAAVLGLFLLIVTAVVTWVGALTFGSIGISSIQILFFFVLSAVAIFNLLVIGEIIEGNFGTGKYILIIFGGCIPILFAFGPLAAFFNPLAAPCGSLLYLWFRVPGLYRKHKMSLYCFIADACIAVILSIAVGFRLLTAFFFILFFGFLLSGCLNFDMEGVNRKRRKLFTIFTSVSAVIVIILPFIS